MDVIYIYIYTVSVKIRTYIWMNMWVNTEAKNIKWGKNTWTKHMKYQ